MAPPLSVTILYNKVNAFGLQEDVLVIERLLKVVQQSIGQTILKPRIADIREPLIHSDIMIHLEIPVFSAIPWAHTNIILVNPEQWSYAYDAYVHAFDLVLFRDPNTTDRFRTDLEIKGIAAGHLHTLPWCSSEDVYSHSTADPKAEFVCFIAGSANKYEYLKELIPHWTPLDPALTIYTTRQDVAEGLREKSLARPINIICKDINRDARQRIMGNYKGHLVVSAGEGFGYAAADAERMGVFTVMNQLPIFTSTYPSTGVSWLSNTYQDSDKVRYSTASPSSSIRADLDQAFQSFRTFDSTMSKARKTRASSRFKELCDAFSSLLPALQAQVIARRPAKGVFHCPPLLSVEDCPPITVITPTYNRKKLIDIAFHNLLATDYPQEKIEWIVIEDNEKTPHMAGEKVMNFQLQAPKMQIKYMPIEGRMSIGQKRNLAIEQATNEIILFMDDDDHYPSTSFRRRVAWLTKGTMRGASQQAIAGCTTIALYDLNKGISAVNVPPLDIACSQRISEATLTFYKSAWEERRFPDTSVSEGEGWLEGRIDRFIEIPPQQIIVAFSHGANQTSRRIPPTDQPPSCFWGFPKEYLIFIHGLVGVQLEEDKKSAKKH